MVGSKYPDLAFTAFLFQTHSNIYSGTIKKKHFRN